ncbi:hypothetical protein [Mesorhizobium sp. WSM2239]|uniref:Uncharacterized protein n=2 Tax=unclassified Mesorhizobium TaxID=325217 RepID=A0AAU8DA58_9HYPH
MELKRIDDSPQVDRDRRGQREIAPLDTKISRETAEALKLIDANIRTAEQKSGYLLVA